MSQKIICSVWTLLLLVTVGQLLAQEKVVPRSGARSSATAKIARSDDTPANVLSSEEWRRVDRSVDRGLAFLAAQQQSDGSFPTLPYAQPGVTSLCVLAFMAHGHAPGSGPYGERLERAVKFIVGCQKPSGLIMLVGDDEPQINRNVDHDVGVAGTYDHAISSLTLSELYGMNPSKSVAQLQNIINKSLAVSLEIQHWPKESPEDEGGWRYLHDYDRSDSDLSVTGWHLMFLRSARNAGFNVPNRAISDAVAYVRRSFSERYGTFTYTINRGDVLSRGMTGAGILAWVTRASTTRSKQSGPAKSCWAIALTSTTATSPIRGATGITTVYSCAAKVRIKWAVPIGSSFFPARFVPCSRINDPTARGTPNPINAIADSVITIPRPL